MVASMATLPNREQRKITFTKAYMAVDGDWLDVTIGNISTAGMMVKCTAVPSLGAEVTIRRRAAGVSGTVQWVNGRRFGLKAAERIDLSAFLAESAAEANQRKPIAVAATPSLFDRVWHWRSRG